MFVPKEDRGNHSQQNSTKISEVKAPKKEERGTYHTDRWLNETNKEEAWSVYAQR